MVVSRFLSCFLLTIVAFHRLDAVWAKERQLKTGMMDSESKAGKGMGMMKTKAGKGMGMMNSKAKADKGKDKNPSKATCKVADSDTGYHYQRMANAFLTEVDNIANERPDDVDAFYEERVAALSTDDVVWDIDAGTRQFQLEGKEAVRGLWTSFSTREFAFHQWSHYEVDKCPGSVKVALRYHGVIREDGAEYQDIFGVIRVNFNRHDLIDNVFVQRFNTIDRGY